MTILTIDPTLFIGSFTMEQIVYDMVESSDATGAEAVRLFGPPRWKVSIGSGEIMNLAQGATWEAMQLQLKRGVNALAVYDPVRVAPQGTLRGNPVVGSAGVAAGVNTMPVSNMNGTLAVGDWLQVGTGIGTSQLLKVVQAATPVSGAASVTFEPALRYAFLANTPITWDHPVFYARSVGKSTRWDYQAGNLLQSGFALSLLETFQ